LYSLFRDELQSYTITLAVLPHYCALHLTVQLYNSSAEMFNSDFMQNPLFGAGP